MSRIGKQAVEVPEGIEVVIDGQHIKVKGPKGSLERELHPTIKVSMTGSAIHVTPFEEGKHGNFHGLTRTLIANMVEGCSKGFKKSLSLVGVGYRAAMDGEALTLNLGYSHPIVVPAVEGIKFSVEKLTTIHIEGACKESVGEEAAKIRRKRPPEPYHGKGVREKDEVIATKVGKASGKK